MGQYIYAIGGSVTYFPFNKVGTAEIYDTKTDTWINGIDLPEPRAYQVSAAIDEEIYAIGGVDLWSIFGGPPDLLSADVESFNVDGPGNLSVSPLDKLSATWGEIKNESD